MQDPLLEGLEGASPLGIPNLPEVFFEEMRRHFRLDGSGRLLALWRGAGTFLSLAGDFESVLIVDPEPGRLADAMRKAERLGIGNAILLEGGAELLHPRMGQFRLVIVQDVFLQRGRMRRLSFLAKMTEPGGGVVVAEVHRCGPLVDWQKAALEVLHRLEGGMPVREPMGRHTAEEVEQPPPFRQTTVFSHRWTQRRTIDQTVQGIRTRLAPSPGRRSLVERLRNTLREAHPSDVLEERFRLTAIFCQTETG
jgi:hypothetical protein